MLDYWIASVISETLETKLRKWSEVKTAISGISGPNNRH